MKNLIRAYRLLNILSIDVAAGAVIGTLFFAKIFAVSILPYGLVSLGLTVWIIYTIDHLIDARKLRHLASSERHRFHQHYFKVLFAFLIAAVVIDSAQLFFIRKIVFTQGLGLAVVIFIYFLIQRSLKFFKEVIGAVLYTGGVLLIPWSVKVDDLATHEMLLIAQFSITALINLMLFSWFDVQRDERDNQSSFATAMGAEATKRLLMVLFLVQVILAAVQLVSDDRKAGFIIMLMNGLLYLIFSNANYFKTEDRFRLLGDAIFLIPVIYVVS